MWADAYLAQVTPGKPPERRADCVRNAQVARVGMAWSGLITLLVAFFIQATSVHAADTRYGLGRPATPAEVAAWDIDVRPDFTGLPKGSGSVERGQDIWEAKCASCHGFFGESNEVFNPIIGGTTPDDVKTGHVKSLTTSELQRTTMMKLWSMATLWDYIRRAMPWNAPKSLSVDDVYAVSAYILNLADLVPASFVLNDTNIRDVEKRLPNRNGATRAHGMWDVRGKPDVRNVACMKDCGEPTIQSTLPDHARNAHGNLAAQNRIVGPVRGVDTDRASTTPSIAAAAGGVSAPSSALSLATRQGCMACHSIDRKLVGPSFRDVASKHRSSGAAMSVLAAKIRTGGAGAWGSIPMPAQSQLKETEAAALAEWIAAGASDR